MITLPKELHLSRTISYDVQNIAENILDMDMERDPNSVTLQEIVDFINKLGYRIDRYNIESNEPDTIVELYCSTLEKLGIVKRDKLKISFAGMEIFSYTGLHDRPIYILKFFNMILKRVSSFKQSSLSNNVEFYFIKG
jgi:hypothetical protein